MKYEGPFILDMVASYKNDERMKTAFNEQYGVGITDFFVKALDEFTNVAKLLHDEKVHHTFAYSVIERIQTGRIYVDNNINPTYCLTL